jgi:hypothetical protein
MHEEMRNTHRILVRNPEGKIRLERPSRRWNNNIKNNFGKWGVRV